MEIRSHAPPQICQGCGMSRQPDLSAFPIPRKGGARPMEPDRLTGMLDGDAERAGEGARASDAVGAQARTRLHADATAGAPPRSLPAVRPPMPGEAPPSVSASSGQVVATTVKLDENRYLRLAEAGKPGPGRMRRRTIQDMVVEALDEWFERRNL